MALYYAERGGLERSIVCALAREGLTQIETFSAGVKGSKDREAVYAISQFLGTRHHDLEYMLEDVLASLPQVIYHLE